MSQDPAIEARQLRLAKNQTLFRSVNEKVEDIAGSTGLAGPISFICECADPECDGTTDLTSGEYVEVREDPKRFVVLPDHVFPEVEVVVSDHGRYAVVEKVGAAGEVAAAADPRGSAGGS